MKRELYSLADEEFAYFTDRLHRQMEKKRMPYIIVGGTATQAHILKILCEQNNETVTGLISNPKIRLQDYIRSTDDIDIAVHSSVVEQEKEEGFAKKFREVLEDISVDEVIAPSGEHIFGYSLFRKGVKRPQYQVFIDGETDERRMIAMNVGRNKSDLKSLDPENYNLFIDKGQRIQIPYSDEFNINANVIKPEYLLAAKISNFRAKDTSDIHGLADMIGGENLDLSEIRGLLLPYYENNYLRFLSLANIQDPEMEEYLQR